MWASTLHRMLLAAMLASLVNSDAMAQQQSQGDPQLDYMLQCQGCHHADGTGTPAVGIPTLVGLADRFLALPTGRAYLVQVPGVSQAPLDNRAIANLMNWILERYRSKTGESSFVPYSEEEVAHYRAAGPIDVVATRARLVERRLRPEPLSGSAEIVP